MFPTRDPLKSAHLMRTMDPINQRLGSGVVRPGVSAGQRKWVAKAEFLLSRYTTRLEEILKVSA